MVYSNIISQINLIFSITNKISPLQMDSLRVREYGQMHRVTISLIKTLIFRVRITKKMNYSTGEIITK